MAYRHFNFLIVLALLVGCQPPPRTASQPLPAPTFRGPAMAHHDAPANNDYNIPPMPPRWDPPDPGAPAADRRDWTPRAAARPWRWIVIHHSATSSGSAAAFDQMHREKGWEELGYHFVIGNGSDSRNGQVEVGSRWRSQKWGAHARTPDNRYNNYGIGICLVGNFETERPTAEQLNALAELIAYLMQTYRIPADRVIGHSDTRATACPGRNLSVAQVRRMATQLAAAESPRQPAPAARTAAGALPADPPDQGHHEH